MRNAVLVLACIACTGRTRRLQATVERWQGTSEDSKSSDGVTRGHKIAHDRELRHAGEDALKPLASLLQTHRPAGLFNPSGPVAPVAATGRSRASHRVPMIATVSAPCQEAESLLKQLSAEGLTPPLAEVLALVQQMQREGVIPDLETFNMAIDACMKEDQWPQAIALLEDMRSSGVKPDLSNFNVAMIAYGKAGEWEKVMELLEEMPEAAVSPDITTFNNAIMALLAAGRFDVAFRLLRMLDSASRAGKFPSESAEPLFTMISEAYIKAMTGTTVQGQIEQDRRCYEAIKAEAMIGLQQGSVPTYENPQEIHQFEMMKALNDMHARVDLLIRPRSVDEFLGLTDPEPLENPWFYKMKQVREDKLPVLRNAKEKQSHRSARYYFCSDEDEHYYWKDHVANKGGIYVGVAAEQNYLISAWTRPEIIILMDLNPYISQLHKAYGVAFGLARTPEEFLKLWEDSDGVDKVLDGVVRKYGETKEAQGILQFINGHPAIGLGFIGLALQNIQQRYEELEIDCFLTNQDQYDFLRNMWRTGRVLPILGDLTGVQTLKDICKLSEDNNLPIKVFYMSNAMYHITVNMFDVPLELLERFRNNFMTMAFDDESLLLHTIQTSANQPGGFKIKSKDLVRQAYICKILGKDSQIPGQREPGKAWVFQMTKGKEFSKWLTEGKKRREQEAIKEAKREKEKEEKKKAKAAAKAAALAAQQQR